MFISDCSSLDIGDALLDAMFQRLPRRLEAGGVQQRRPQIRRQVGINVSFPYLGASNAEDLILLNESLIRRKRGKMILIQAFKENLRISRY